MKKLITHAELMSALGILGFEDGAVFRVEIRPRETSDVTIGAGKDSGWVLIATVDGCEKDGFRVVPPFGVRVVTIPVLMFGRRAEDYPGTVPATR